MEKNPKIAIIVINWNGFDDTVECLKSLKKLDYNNFKIVLVDNNSKNNQGSKLKEIFPDIHLIKNKINRGFTGGNNDGIKWAQENGFEYVWLLNNDTVVERESLKYQISHFKDKSVGAVGSKIKIYGTDLIWSKGIYLLKISFLPPEIKFFSNIDEGKKDTIYETTRELKYISGCSILLKTKLKNIFFDEKFFAYCEDMDLCYRIRKEGYKLLYEPRSVVYHKTFRSYNGRKFSKTAAYYSYRNKLIFLNNIYPKYILFLISPFYLACFIRDIFRIVVFYKSKKVFSRSILKGFSDGFKYILENKNSKG